MTFSTSRARHLVPAVTALFLALSLAACGGAPASSTSMGEKNAGPKSKYTIGLVYFAPEEGNDHAQNGLIDGLKEEGFEQGNLEIRKAHAQGEIANIPMLIQNYDSQADIDVIVPMTTPVLTAAASMTKHKPVVFTYVYDPIAAGAGTSLTDHLPNVTGVGSFPPVGETFDVIKDVVPNVKAIGTLYNTSEANSVKVVSVGREEAAKRGLKLEEVSAASTGEVFQAAQALAQRHIQAIWMCGDNTALQAFDGILKVAQDAKLPIFTNDIEFTAKGAVVGVGLGWYESGKATAKILARVLRGESPKDIPIQQVAVRKIVVNKDAAAHLKLTLPPALLKEAGE